MVREKTTKVTRKQLAAPKKSIMTKKIVTRKSIAAEPHKEGEKRKRRSKPGSKVNRDIKLLQKTSKLIIPKCAFGRLVREVTNKYGLQYRFAKMAMIDLQEASENLLVDLMSDSNLLAQHAHRVTVFDRDIKIYMRVVRPQWAKVDM